MNLLAHGQQAGPFFIGEAIFAGGLLISLVAAFGMAGNARDKRRCFLWATGFLIAGLIWPALVSAW